MPFRAEASLKYGPAPTPTVNTQPYKDRLANIKRLGTDNLQASLVRAAERKANTAYEQELSRKATLEKTQQNIQQRVTKSQNTVTQLQQDTSAKYAQIAKQNARLKRQQTKLAAPREYNNSNFQSGMGQVVPVGGAGGASKVAAGIINEAMKYRGRMYQWGGASPKTSFDCSGLVQWAYKSMGITVPRVSSDQANFGRKIPLKALRPGDLVAWDNSSRNNGADHIAIFIGNGQIIEAARTGTPVRVSNIYDSGRAWGVQILK